MRAITGLLAFLFAFAVITAHDTADVHFDMAPAIDSGR